MLPSRLIRVGLAAALLFAGLPAWKHAHPGGDRPHRHTHDHAGHSHLLGRHHHADGHSACGECHAHLHVTLLGVEFTLPAEPDDDETEEGRPVYLVDAPATPSEAATPLLLPPPFVLPLTTAPPLADAPAFRPKTVIAAPLCDAARHERSGVLLV